MNNMQLLHCLQRGVTVCVENEQESYEVLQACEDLGIRWKSGDRTAEWSPLTINYCSCPYYVLFERDSTGLAWAKWNSSSFVQWAAIRIKNAIQFSY